MEIRVGSSNIEIIQGDITRQSVDAIVNAANSMLAGGGGVDGAIHRCGGPAIMRETRQKYPDGCPTGEAVVSGAGLLPCRFVIHTVGPIWTGGAAGESERLSNAYRNSLCRAEENGCKTMAFPAISCGVYGYPLESAAGIALRTTFEYLSGPTEIKRVRFVLFSEEVRRVFEVAASSVEC